MESLQLSQVLADLSNLGAAEPQAAAAIVSTNPSPVNQTFPKADQNLTSGSAATGLRPTPMSRAWSSEPSVPPKFDKLGRRILVNPPTGSRPTSRAGSAGNSTPGTPGRTEFDPDGDLDRAATLIALYDIRAKIKQQDNSNLLRAREKINALAAKQQAQQTAERNLKTADELRRNRYSFPKTG